MSLDKLSAAATTAIESAADTRALDEVRVQYLGKSGHITAELKNLGALPAEERKARGAEINRIRDEVASMLETRKSYLEQVELTAKLNSETIDVTLPASPVARGSIHPITQVTEELTAIFADFGFSVAEGPEIEDDFHNFTALNIPESHPARQMHDTFYLKGDGKDHPVLRTHTSPVQIRTMQSGKPPIRIIAPGTTYRSDSDQTHTPMFHQVEGLVIEKGVHMGHLKGLLHDALAAFFGLETLPMRFRPSFFPFTEPSAEVDIGCRRGKDALIIGEGSDWLEIAGCGMVHPNVLKNCGIDPEVWQGFAFGAGIERLAMLKYNIPDLRTMFTGDVRWLKHYGFPALDIPSLVKGVGA
ncbi:MAG: phenylalanine--tRNA ligase subunit alpha [Alphaproteobacteria bacterium]